MPTRSSPPLPLFLSWRRCRWLLVLAGLLLFPVLAFAAPTGPQPTGLPQVNIANVGGEDVSVSLAVLLSMTALTLLPSLLLACTAFTRIIVVMALLRMALGTGQTPSNQIMVGLALFLTMMVMMPMPADAPATVITQHIPAEFSRPFAERLNKHSAMVVMQAEDGAPILAGHAYVAPGGKHLEVVRDGARWRCRVIDTEPVNRHKPSVGVMFNSVLKAAGSNCVAALLTGMGDDGSRELLALRQAGVRTVVQNEATSVVWGMPGTAYRLGAADEVLPLEQISARLLELARSG